MKKTIAFFLAIALSLGVFAQQQRDTMFVHTTDRFIHEFATHDIDSIIFYRTQDRMELPRDTVRDTVIQTITIFDTIRIFDTVVDTIFYCPEIVDVTGVTLNPTAVTLIVGETEMLALTATVLPENATNQNITWTSNNSDVATVDEYGFVMAVSAGIATITAITDDGNFTATAKINVFAWELIFADDFGTGAPTSAPSPPPAGFWPTVNDWSNWSRTGSSVGTVSYSGTNATVRSNSVSNFSGASGGNNIMFGTGATGGSLIINGILPENNRLFYLSFGTNVASETLSVAFSTNNGFSWTPIVFEKTNTAWGLVETAFIIPEGASTLSLRFSALQTQFGARIDDVELRGIEDNVSVFGNSIISDSEQAVRFQIVTASPWTAEITSGSAFAEIVSPTSGTGSGFIDIAFQGRNPNTDIRRATLEIITENNQHFSMTLTQGQIVGNTSRYVPFRLELPLVRDTTWFIQHDVDGIVNFALEYDTAQRHAFWVAYILTTELLSGTIDRGSFTWDPNIPIEFQPHEIRNGVQSVPRYWTLYGYERGHIMASADRRFSQEANDQSNFFSNISPHLPEFHNSHGGTGSGEGVWLRLENQIRTWARQSDIDTLYVVKGGSILPGAPGTEIVETLYRLNNAVVPRWHFKAIVQRRGDSFYGIAFWLEQYRGMARRPARRTDAITIRELEQLTGINFFPNLRIYGESIGQPNLENAVETTPINWSRWPGIN